jgi:hypothetical protein
MNIFGALDTIGSDLQWLSDNAFLVFGIALLLIIVIIAGIIAVK